MMGRQMQSLTYPATLTPQPDGGFIVDFPDIPWAHTDGEGLQDALVQAADCLSEALASRIVLTECVPTPSAVSKSHYPIDVPLGVATKVAVYAAMREQGLDPAGLAKRLGWAEKRVRQLLDPSLDTRMDEAQTALDALGKRVTLSVDDAA